jgi:signal transduction histidine kinase
MIGSGSATIGAVYLLYRLRWLQHFASLRWTLLVIIILTVMLMFVNVFITAQLMFISTHDLVLTSALLIYAGIVAVISVLFIAGTLTDRIQQLSAAMRRVAGGDLRARLPAQGKDELAGLATLFNQMTQQLETVDAQKRALDQTRRDLVAWASHDLRSPLAAVRAMNEAILDGVVRDEATLTSYRQQMQREIEHLGRLIDDLFEMAQIDAGGVITQLPLTALAPLIDEVIGGVRARAQANQVRLVAEVAGDLPRVPLAADKIKRVIYNLLDNAIHYTPTDGHIHVRAQQKGERVEIAVYNSGSYIAPHDMPHIFERFYRAEGARTPRSDGQRGTGLGLAIARGFVEAHGGGIRAESSAAHGTTFTFWLPIKD